MKFFISGKPINITEHMYNISNFNKTEPDYKGLLKSDVLAMFEFSRGLDVRGGGKSEKEGNVEIITR